MKYFGSRAVSTIDWSISKNFQFSPGSEAQVSVPEPRPITGDPQRRALALADRRDRLSDAAVLVIIGDRLRPAGDRRAVVIL